MLVKKTVSLIIGLTILGLTAFALLQAAKHSQIKRLRTSFKDKSTILLDNLSKSISSPRKHPLSTIELEESLKLNSPVPFASFSQENWKWFWHLLYGTFTQDVRGWPKRKRQLTKQEIQGMLTDYYYKPFGSFGQRQWNIFWQRILKGRVFKK